MTMTIKRMKMEETIPVIIVDSNGIITMINKAFEKQYGWKKGDLEGSSLFKIIPEELQDAHIMGFSRYLLNEKSHILNQPLNLKIKTSDGLVLNAEHLIISEKKGDKIFFAAFISNVDQKR